MSQAIHVVAGVVSDAAERVLVTRRPSGKHLAGLWEFPGGKCESGESAPAALRRELDEELGIQVGNVEPLIRIPWRYPEKEILLDVYRVKDFRGEPRGRESQALCWHLPMQLLTLPMPAADRPVISALRLPVHYAITPEPERHIDAFLASLESVLATGIKLIQLRTKVLLRPQLTALAREAHTLASQAGAQILINAHVELAQELDLGGVHLTAKQLMCTYVRPLTDDRWVGASCHNMSELQHAAAIGVDFVTLSPVLFTASHASSAPLGWEAVAALCARTPLPCYALGGIGRDDLMQARSHGAHGVAGISGFWSGGARANFSV